MATNPEHDLIVVPLDGSEQAEQVIPYAEALRGRGGTLLFFQAFSPAGAASGLFGDVEITMEDIVAREREVAKARLNEIAERWDTVLDKQPEVESFAGDAVEAIEAIVRDRDATMLAISSSGRGALSRWAFGSVADTLTRSTPVPLLIIHPSPESEGSVQAVELKRILVPLDGSETADAAAPVAGRLARSAKLPVVLVQVINPSLEFSMVGQGMAPITAELYDQVESDLTAQADDALNNGAELLGEVPAGITKTVLQGSTVEAMQHYAQPGDLIVMTSHGRTGVRRFLLGSVAQKIINERVAPVVLVPVTDGPET